MKKISKLAIITISILVLCTPLLFVRYAKQEPIECITTISSNKVKAAMEYHGILFAIHQTGGGDFFYRNGKRCKLFTNAFEEYWSRRNK